MLVLVASIDLLAAGVMLLTLPLVPVFMWLVGRQTERRARERWQALALLSNHFLDVVRGLPTLRAFNRSQAQAERIVEVSEEYRRTTMGTLRVAFLSGAVLELAATLAIALVAVVVGVRLAEGGIGFEPALTILVLTPELYLPLRNLSAQFHASADGAAVAERLLELADVPGVRAGTASPPDPALEPITFEGVSFRYPARDVEVLRGVDLEVRPGETVAIVGPSGVGKSTLVSLLLRFAEPSAGRILVGGRDLADLDQGAWRRQTALVPQHPTLFRGTVADNIRLGDPSADDDRVRRAAELAGAHELVSRLPRGYETVVGEGGRSLSAGQRRRLALARAFLRDAPLVVLDEPTADLDPESAAGIAEAIERLRAGRTVVLVAHRSELVARCGPDRASRARSGPRDGGGGMTRRFAGCSRSPSSRAGASFSRSRSVRRAVGFGVALMATAGYLISRAAEQPPILVADDDHRRRPLPRARPSARALSRAPRVPRPRVAGSREDPRDVLRAHRAARARGARGVSPR